MTVATAAVELPSIKRELLDLTETGRALIPEINPHYSFPDCTGDVTKDLRESRKVMLTGHMGTGKTTLFEQIAAKVNQPTMRVNMNGQTTIADFVGFWMVKGGETIWVDGALPLAMKEGYWLIVDEFDFADAPILSVLNPVAEKNGKLFLKEKGHEIIHPHPSFRLCATANTVGAMEYARVLYQGANVINRALLDRFRVYLVEYLESLKEAKLLQNVVPSMPPQVATTLVKLANEIRKAFNDEEISTTFSLRSLIDMSEMMARYRGSGLTHEEIVVKAATTCIYSKVSAEDKEYIEKAVQRICMGALGGKP